MASLTNINSISCGDIGAVDGISAASISKFDNIDFCLTPTPTQTPGGSPTPTPTVTPTVTPTPTPSPECNGFCCEAELCYGDDCSGACSCTRSGLFYLSVCNEGTPCYLENASGIYVDNRCGEPAPEAYYSDQTGCYYWNGADTLNYSSAC